MQSPKKEVIIPEGGAKSLAPYSPGIRFGNLIFTSGQIGLDPNTGKILPGGVAAETHQAIKNIEKILKASGSKLENILKVCIYVRDIDDYGTVNKVYGEYFTDLPPARSVVQGKLPAEALVELDAIAFVG